MKHGSPITALPVTATVGEVVLACRKLYLNLDGAFYATYIVLLSIITYWISFGVKGSETTPPVHSDLKHLSVKQAGTLLKIPTSDIQFIRADGNFAAIHCVGSSTILHHLRLGQLMENPPALPPRAPFLCH